MFLSNINAAQSGPTGTDFTVLGQSRAKRSDPCTREQEGQRIEACGLIHIENTWVSLQRALGIDHKVLKKFQHPSTDELWTKKILDLTFSKSTQT